MLSAAASIAFALSRKHIYASETVILYREVIRSAVLHGDEDVIDREDQGTKLKELVLSRSRLQDIVDEMELFPEIVRERGYVAAVEELRNRIEFESRGGDVFHIRFLGDSPEVAHQVTEYLADSLIEEEARTRAEQVTATKKFLDQELANGEQELRRRETEVAKFLGKYPEFGLESQTGVGASVRAQQKRKTPRRRRSAYSDSTTRRLESQIDRIETLVRGTRSAVNTELLREKQDTEARLAETKSELSELQTRFTDAHPDVRAALSRVRSAERRAKRAKAAVRDAQKASERDTPETRALKDQLADLKKQLDQRRAKLRREAASNAGDDKPPEPPSDIVDLETEWTRLNREVQEARERYELLETKHFRASIDANSQLATQTGQMAVIDPAYVPIRPAGAGRKIIVLAGTFAGGAIGFVIALLLALMDDRFFSRRDIDRLEGLPLLVVVPPTKRRGMFKRLLLR